MEQTFNAKSNAASFWYDAARLLNSLASSGFLLIASE